MSTVAQVIDRCYRDYLAQADDQPVRVRLADAVANAAVGLVMLDLTLLPADAQEAVAPGMVIEVGREQMLVTTEPTGDVYPVARGVNGTTASAHAAGALVNVAPAYTRQSVFDAVADNVVNLFPRLWATRFEEITLGTGFTEVPADVARVVQFRTLSGNYYYTVDATLASQFPDSATGKAVVVDASPGTTGILVYRSGFTRPTLESENLDDLGVRAEWERIVVVGAAAQLLSARDVEVGTLDFVTEQLQAEAMPPTTEGRISARLLAVHEKWIDEAGRALTTEDRKRIRRMPLRRGAVR